MESSFDPPPRSYGLSAAFFFSSVVMRCIMGDMETKAVRFTASRGRRVVKFAALAATGGLVFQTTGCAAGLSPVFLSVLESLVIEWILGAAFPPLII